MDQIIYGAAGQSRTVMVLLEDTSGNPVTGVAHTDVTASYCHTRTARTAITMASLASATAAWSSGGWYEVDATNCPGLYRFDVPDAAMFAPSGVSTTATQMVLTVKATGCRTRHIFFQVTHWDTDTRIGHLCWGQDPKEAEVLGDDTMGLVFYKALNRWDTNIYGVTFEGVDVNLAQTGYTPRALDTVADSALTTGDLLVAGYVGGVGDEAIVGTAYTKKTAATNTTVRTLTLDDADTPTSRT